MYKTHAECPDAAQPGADRKPCPLFFSGGTALGPVATALARSSAHAVHVITPFDSGGSSAALREAFTMPAVGDIRARIMALADSGRPGYAEATALFSHRLPGVPSVLPNPACPAGNRVEQNTLLDMLKHLAQGQSPLICGLPDADQAWAREHLDYFLACRPEDLDLAGACIGNLILTAEYLKSGRSLKSAAASLVQRAGARGEVIPVVEDYAHLCVRLENGEQIIGQHRFTGKSVDRITSPIRSLWLSASLGDPEPITVRISPELAARIRRADLICYPVGSFFSSVLANLLPLGVSEAVRQAACPKVFIPNLGNDPELLGYTVQDQVAFLLEKIQPARLHGSTVGRPQAQTTQAALTALLIDTDETRYPGGIPHTWLHRLDIKVIRAELVTPESAPFLDAERVCRQIMTLMN